MRPEIGLAALKLLEASGCEVVVPEVFSRLKRVKPASGPYQVAKCHFIA